MNLSIYSVLKKVGKLDCHTSVILHGSGLPSLSVSLYLLQSSSNSLSRIIPSSFTGSSIAIGRAPLLRKISLPVAGLLKYQDPYLFCKSEISPIRRIFIEKGRDLKLVIEFHP